MSPYETIRLSANLLASGESVRMRCPWCHGGRSQEHSFIITRDGGNAKYVCHRATCVGYSSGALSIAGTPVNWPVSDKPKPKAFEHKTYRPSEYVLDLLESKYQISKQAVDFYSINQTGGNDIAIPIFSDNGIQQGTLVRLDKPTKTKALTYHTQSSDGLAWYTGRPDYEIDPTLLEGAILFKEYMYDALILVEDMYSAIKANYFMDSVALLGTHLNSHQAAKIAMKEYKKVMLALDADASAQAVRTALRLRVILPNLRVVILDKDLKDIPFNSLGTFLSENYRRIS